MYTKLTLEISHTAEDDFKHIWKKCAEKGREVGAKVLQDIAHKIFTLEYLANNYPETSKNDHFGLPYREIDCDPYKVLFQIDKKYVQVLRIL